MAYSVPEEDILTTGVRFTVAEIREMADAYWAGRTPPPLSYNEAVILMAMIRADHERNAIEAGR